MSSVFSLSRSSGCRAVTSAGQRISLPVDNSSQIRVWNSGPNKVCISAGDGTQLAVMPTDAATLNGVGVVIPPNGNEVFTLPGSSSSLHAVCAAGETATIYCNTGVGA